MGHSLGFAPEAALEDLGLPLWGPGVEVVQLLGSQGFWQPQVLRGVGGWGSRKYSALEGYGDQLVSKLQYSCLENPLPDREAWQPTVYRVAKSSSWPKWHCTHRRRLLACSSSLPVRVECEGGMVSWLVRTLAAPSVQAHGLLPVQELWPCQGLFSSFLWLVIRMPFWPVFLRSSTCSGT